MESDLADLLRDLLFNEEDVINTQAVYIRYHLARW